ncbi:SIR2 family protein [Sphingomonas nostoxanthinifaciens]|uniref:SIR2 family protein n=1 Tax=Sphingomonas nostoxanthinifaciens TaxID=2872652 RepID=UPI001CC1CC33|nr:SIR2 family protein [Sphingomonas nostoxanthinifaciens]UAK23736.1 SIR2 family protein [Sphingomonas nostoxanthinifaciens]
MELHDAVRIAFDGDAVLFAGAGLSFLSKTADDTELPAGNALKDILLDQPLGTGSPHPLDRVAGHAVRTRGVDWVFETLKASLTVSKVDDRLSRLYNLPWRRIYTTNYDNAAELCRKGNYPESSLTIDDEVSRSKPGSVVHLNGSIASVGPEDLQAGLALTDLSYATSRLTSSDWFRLFLRDLKTARAIIFAGYSLYDLDIARALIEDETLARKVLFFVSPGADTIELGTMSQYGHVIDGGVFTLTKAIAEVFDNYEPRTTARAFVALEEVKVAEAENRDTNAQKLYQQMVYGRLQQTEYLQEDSVFGMQPYLVTRQQDRDAVSAIQRGPWRDVLFLGEIASGKTASCLVLAKYLIATGYRVYYARRSASLIDELGTLARSGERAAVIFEDYASLTAEVREFVSLRKQEQRVVLTARSVSHELISDFLEKTAHLGPVYEIILDRIDQSDADQFEALVNFGGFWGDKAGANPAARKRIITDVLQGSLYKLLLEVIESEKVQADVSALLAPLRPDRRALKLFMSSFIVNVLGLEFSINDWQTVFEAQWVRRIMRTYSEQVKNFLNVRGDTIFPRAGVLSAHILKTFSEDELVRECLVDLYERAIKGESTDEDFKSLRFKLTRYGSIEPLFGGAGKSANISRYYDEIRVFGGTENNPDYWLQVGIAATIHGDLPKAGKAFQNAYSRERAKKRPNTKKIDNYYSRYEMHVAIAESDPTEAFKTFTRASEQLKKQMFMETDRHYPYKTGRHYTDVAAKHFSRWTDEQKLSFIKNTDEIRDRAYEWNKKRNEFSVDVEVLIRETTILLDRLRTA